MRTVPLLLPCLLGLPAAAQKAKAPEKVAVEPTREAKVNWDGEWSLHVSQSDKVDERIEEHVKDLNFAMKLYWKKKLQSACQGFNKLDITAGETFSVVMGKERAINTPADGTEADWKNSENTTFKVSLAKDGPALIQSVVGDGHTMKYVYTMRKDGNSLALQVTYSHPKLENPFSYKLVFKRND